MNKLRYGFEMGEHPELYNIMLFTRGCVAWPLCCFSGCCPFRVYGACCVVLLRLLRGIAPVYSACCVVLHRLLCGLAPILFAALAVWCCSNLMYSGCCVAVPLSRLRRLPCGVASILCTAVAVWHCPYPVYSACLRGLLLLKFVLCTVVAVWHRPYPVFHVSQAGKTHAWAPEIWRRSEERADGRPVCGQRQLQDKAEMPLRWKAQVRNNPPPPPGRPRLYHEGPACSWWPSRLLRGPRSDTKLCKKL